MPLSKYYGGAGEEVMASMKKQYGDRAENVFYATANKMKRDVEGARKKHRVSRKVRKG